MNENAQKWVQALRSGEYKQTSGRLRRRDSFCCLGVACDLYAKETGQGEWEDDPAGQWFVVLDSPRAGTLPDEVRDWLGLRGTSGEYGCNERLSDDNDLGTPFEQIAATVEAEPRGLFE